MRARHLLTGLSALGLIAGCSTYDPAIKTGNYDRYEHEIRVVEETVVLEVPMSAAEPGIPYSEQRRVEVFLSSYKSKGARHGPLILSVPQNSPFAAQLEISAREAYDLAYDYGVKDIKRSDYESNGAPEAPMVLAYRAFKAIPPDCPSLASIDLAGTRGNDPQPRFGCAMQANLAAMVADPADLIGARPEDPADTVRRVDVLTKYRAGQPTSTERTEAESGTVSQAID